MAFKLHGWPGMALVTNMAGAAGTTSGVSGAPADSGGIAGLMAALTAIPGSVISSQPALAAHSTSGSPVIVTSGGAGSAGVESQKAQWAKVFDFFQHASVDAETAPGSGQTLTTASTPDTAQRSGTALAATTQTTAAQGALTGARASGMETGSLATTESMLAASQGLPTTSPAMAAPAKVISIQAGLAADGSKTSSARTHSATQKQASAAQKSMASPASPNGVHIAAPVPPMPTPIPALLPAASRSALPSPALLSPALLSSAQSGPAQSSSLLSGGLAFGASVADAGLARGLEAVSTALPQPVESGVVQSGSNHPGQSGQMGQFSSLPGSGVNFSAVMGQTTPLGVDGAATPEKWVQPIQPTVGAMRLPELAAGERSLSSASTRFSAASSASPSIADVISKPVSSTIPSPSVSTQVSQIGSGSANLAASGATTSSLSASSGVPKTQGPDLSSAAVPAMGSASGHPSTADPSVASKSGTSMHGAAQPSVGAPQAGTWAATMAGHPGENPASVTGATVSGATSGATFGAQSVTATSANGHAAPAQHPGQVFEALDAASGAWNPAQQARTISGGASLSVGYQDARLGYVELQARQVAGGVQATLVPSSEAARRALEGQLGSLGGWLAQRATPVDRLAVGMPSSMAAMTTDHGGAMNPGGAMNSGGAMDQGRTPNPSLMQSMAQAAQQGLAGGASERGSRGSSGESTGGNHSSPNAVGAVGGVESSSFTPAGFAPATLDRGSTGHAMQNEMRMEAARIGVGQTISVRA